MARRRKRRRLVEPLSAVLSRDAAFGEIVNSYAAPVSPRDWEMAVGTRIAARAKPTRLQNGILFITAATAAWSNELSLLSDPILKNLRKNGLEVRELRFRVGAIDPPLRPRRPIKIAPRPASLDSALANALGHVADDALRESIEMAARKNLGYEQDSRNEAKLPTGRRGEPSK